MEVKSTLFGLSDKVFESNELSSTLINEHKNVTIKTLESTNPQNSKYNLSIKGRVFTATCKRTSFHKKKLTKRIGKIFRNFVNDFEILPYDVAFKFSKDTPLDDKVECMYNLTVFNTVISAYRNKMLNTAFKYDKTLSLTLTEEWREEGDHFRLDYLCSASIRYNSAMNEMLEGLKVVAEAQAFTMTNVQFITSMVRLGHLYKSGDEKLIYPAMFSAAEILMIKVYVSYVKEIQHQDTVVQAVAKMIPTMNDCWAKNFEQKSMSFGMLKREWSYMRMPRDLESDTIAAYFCGITVFGVFIKVNTYDMILVEQTVKSQLPTLFSSGSLEDKTQNPALHQRTRHSLRSLAHFASDQSGSKKSSRKRFISTVDNKVVRYNPLSFDVTSPTKVVVFPYTVSNIEKHYDWYYSFSDHDEGGEFSDLEGDSDREFVPLSKTKKKTVKNEEAK